MANHNITLITKNGMTVKYSEVPDCWHAAMYIKDHGNPAMGSGVELSEMVLDCWHMAHDYRDALKAWENAHVIDSGSPYKSVEIGYSLIRALHECNMADVEDIDGNPRNDLPASASHDTYRHIAAALTSLGFNEAREVYASEGDVEAALEAIGRGVS